MTTSDNRSVEPLYINTTMHMHNNYINDLHLQMLDLV